MHFTSTDEASILRSDELVFFASYEERSLRVARNAAESGFSGTVRVLFCEDLASVETRASLAEFRRLFGSRCTPVGVASTEVGPIVEFTQGFVKGKRILVDVTCFTRGLLFTMLWGWRLGIENMPLLTFAYCPASSYGDWLSRDFERPQNIVGFSGPPAFPKLRNLVALVGFDSDRAAALIEYLEPSEIVFGVGSEPSKIEFIERSRSTITQLRNLHPGQVHELDIGDPERTAFQVDSLVRGFSDDATVNIAPFNNKISCLAVYSVWLKHPLIRLWNVLPKTYNFLGYSNGASEPKYFAVSW